MAWNIQTTRSVTPDLEILAHITGNEDVAESIVLDASAFPLNAAGERELLAGQPLKKSGNQYVPWVGAGNGGTDTRDNLAGILNHSERVPDTDSHSDVVSAMWNFGQWFLADRIVGWAGDSVEIKAGLPNCKFS